MLEICSPPTVVNVWALIATKVANARALLALSPPRWTMLELCSPPRSSMLERCSPPRSPMLEPCSLPRSPKLELAHHQGRQSWHKFSRLQVNSWPSCFPQCRTYPLLCLDSDVHLVRGGYETSKVLVGQSSWLPCARTQLHILDAFVRICLHFGRWPIHCVWYHGGTGLWEHSASPFCYKSILHFAEQLTGSS
jgi:hypothetical protein